MRILIIGGTQFVGRRVTERLHERGEEVLVVHRGRGEPATWVPVTHLHTDRHHLGRHRDTVREFDPQLVLDTCAMTATDVDAVLPVLPDVPTVVLSSQDVYQAHTGLRTGTSQTPLPLTEDSEPRRERYPYRGSGIARVPEDYGRGRDRSCERPPAQIPACGTTALGSYLG